MKISFPLLEFTILTRFLKKAHTLPLFLRVLFYGTISLGLLLTALSKLFSEEKNKLTCIKNHKLIFCLGSPANTSDLLSLPLVCAATVDKIPFLECAVEGIIWNMTALYVQSVGELMVDFYLKYQKNSLPLMAFIQDAAGDEYLMTINPKGEHSISSLSSLIEQSTLIRKKIGSQNYLGYSLEKGERILCYFQQQYTLSKISLLMVSGATSSPKA